MWLNIILIVIALACLAYLGYIIFRKFPILSNINTKEIPGLRDVQTKQKILEDKLKRDVVKNWDSLRDFFGLRQWSLRDVASAWQERLSKLEREYRKMIHKDLSSQVKKNKQLEDLLDNAKTYLTDEEYVKAEEVLIDILSLDEHNIEAYFLLTQVYQSKKELDHARETLEYLLKLTHNEDPKVFQNLAQLSMARGNLKQAEEDYLRSISLDENNYLYYLNLAEVYLSMGEQEKALEAAKQSLVLAPNNPKVLDFLIELSIILHDAELGIKYLERLQEANPDNNKIDALRTRLEQL